MLPTSWKIAIEVAVVAFATGLFVLAVARRNRQLERACERGDLQEVRSCRKSFWGMTTVALMLLLGDTVSPPPVKFAFLSFPVVFSLVIWAVALRQNPDLLRKGEELMADFNVEMGRRRRSEAAQTDSGAGEK